MENFESVYILTGAINGIFKLVVVAGCVLLLMKDRNVGTILMFVGSILSIFFSIGSVLLTSLAASRSAETLVKSNAMINLVGQIPVILFAIGLLLLAIRYSKGNAIS
nr:hypothetical protein [Allomuricauda sp.]